MITTGTQVRWTSCAASVWKTKTGTVVDVVPAGTTPDRCHTQLHRSSGCGSPRNHESYVVKVTNGRSSKLYWPRVKALDEVVA